MGVEIRAAVRSDIEPIAAWTADTFAWGDYVADELPGWLDDPAGTVLVIEQDGAVAAVGRVTMVTTTEAWLQGVRVRPDVQRRGLGSSLGEALSEWARDQGAQVIRLAVEEDNPAAMAHYEALGYRHSSDWWFARRSLGATSPVPEGNGGRRVQAAERLQEAHSAEAEAAFLSWSAGELARHAKGLLPIDWVWRLMTVEHVEIAARNHALWEGRPGWAVIEQDDHVLRVHWLETSEDDARSMIRALIDLGVERGAERVTAVVPTVPWLGEALEGSEFTLTGGRVYALAL